MFGYFKEFTADKVGVTIGTELREELFTHIQGLSMDYFGKTNTGELMARVKDDVDHIMYALGFVGMLVVQVIIHVVSVLYCMFHLNWKLTFIPLAFMTLCGTVAIVMERKLDKIYEDISEENAELTTVAEENLAGVRTVKAFAREKYEIEKFLSHNKRYYELNMSQAAGSLLSDLFVCRNPSSDCNDRARRLYGDERRDGYRIAGCVCGIQP